MWWNLLFSVVTVLLPQEHENSKNLPEFAVNTPTVLNPDFVPTAYGPQTPEEDARIRKALSGKYFGGDMVLPKDWNTTDAGLRDTKYRWPGFPIDPVVPFVIHPSLYYMEDIIDAAFGQMRNTCIRFVRRSNQTDYLVFHKGDRCHSEVGRVGGVQYLSLAPECNNVGIIIHLIFRALGCIYEHQRSDRDNYILVHKENVIPEKLHNFDKFDQYQEIQLYKYDLESIMQLGNTAYSRNGGWTMEAKNGQRLIEPYQRPGLSAKDIKMILYYYQCRQLQ